MKSATAQAAKSAFDLIGSYSANRVYELPDQIVDRMLEAMDLGSATAVLDARASDGGLLRHVVDYCRRHGFTLPALTAMAPSPVQVEFVRAALSGLPATVVQGDLLNLKAGPETVDRIALKSVNHQVPPEQQMGLYEGVFRALSPGGRFVNLGFLFDDPQERDEFGGIVRLKDDLARPHGQVVRRHFLLRDELYGFLKKTGFVDIACRQHFDYAIHSSVIEEAHFAPDGAGGAGADLQAAQARARRLRRAGRIHFERDHSLMLIPAELTVGRKPTCQEETQRAFRTYPMDLLRRVEAHRRMLAEAVGWIRPDDRILDLGCGIGLLAEQLLSKGVAYRGLDLSADFIRICRERYGGQSSCRFEQADLNEVSLDREAFDVVTLLNTLNMPGLNAIRVLQQARAALRSKGLLIVSGPTSQESLVRAEPLMLAQLERDGVTAGGRDQIEALREANRRLLTERANYWSVEGMIELLLNLGFRKAEAVDTQQYYGFAYMIVARKEEQNP